MKKFLSGILSVMLIIVSIIGNANLTIISANEVNDLGVYKASEDAYIRSDRSTTNYNYENITSAHGAQYAGKNYKALSTKTNGNQGIYTLLKLPLPTQEEVDTNKFNKYYFTFHIFKNADPNNGNQTYHFYYSEDVSWNETSVKYSTKPASFLDGNDAALFDFSIEKGKAYESLTDEEKTITMDITDVIQPLIEKGVTAISIYTKAQNSINTSLMIHSRESSNGEYAPQIEAKQEIKKEFATSEDAFIRSDRGTTNYSYENITSAHGAQYADKGYKVLNAKYYPNGNQIIALMKYDLPTKEEVLENGYNTYTLAYDIFKNPNGYAQTYDFYYSTDVSWSASSITYNTAPSEFKGTTGNKLSELAIEEGFLYEPLDDTKKHIEMDITDTIKSLIENNISSITVYVKGRDKVDTSLMFHSMESADGSKTSKIIASKTIITPDQLKELIDACEAINLEAYKEEGKEAFQQALLNAKNIYQQSDADNEARLEAYKTLTSAKESLQINADINDPDNIAYEKPTRSNLNKEKTSLVTDGDVSTYWNGIFYPSYVDVDLMDTYALNKLVVYVPTGKQCWYTIYGSNDGKDYDRLYQYREEVVSDGTGHEINFEEAKNYRIIRVYMEYTKGDDVAYLTELKAFGEKSNTNTNELRKGTFEEILQTQSYDQTTYADEITEAETIENVYGIIDRTIGAQYRNWFTFEIAPNTENTNDYYELSDVDGKIHIKGNEGLSLATGLNYYYKNYVHVQISEQIMQVNMPENIVLINEVVRKETPYSVRYAYNYCTLSYTYAFFGEEEWQRENDWLALNGVNVVLDLAGQEATWIKFLMNFGYSFDDAKDWLTGPSYYAWQFMDNMESFGGPIPDGYVVDRLELARSSQRWKNSLGMQTILQGYAGMVPTNFNEFQPDVQLCKQGGWNGFSRPHMIATDTQTYDEYARLFYQAQEYVYGTRNHYYAVDPFHEGGIRPSTLSDATISQEVLESMLAYDSEAVWVVQGWQSNPTNGLLEGMGENRIDHVLIVDLIKYPIESWTKYDDLTYGSTTLNETEFNNTSWAWTLLANFGGNPTMNAQLEVMVNDIQNAKKTMNHMVGLGVISEAMYDNPMVYDLLFDLAWAEDSFNLDRWMSNYLLNRYGEVTTNVLNAWNIIKDKNYSYGVRYTNEVYGTKNKKPQDYGTQSIPYGAENLETALRLLLRDFDALSSSPGYLYDLSEIMRQHVSNYSVLKYNEVLEAKKANDLDSFITKKNEFINSLEVLNTVSSTQKEQLGGEWIGKAKDRSATYDDFSKDAFTMNAKALITTWGSRKSNRSLKDYGWRNYEGIFTDIYAANWIEYLNRVEANLRDGTALNNLDINGYFDIYWKWILEDQNYTRDALDSPTEIQEVATKVLNDCMLSGEISPNVGNVALNGIASASGIDSDDAEAVNDGDATTSITALQDESGKSYAIVDLIAQFELSEIQVVLNESSASTNYQVYVSNDLQNWKSVGEKTAVEEDVTKGSSFKSMNGTYRFVKVEAQASTLAISEIRAYGERMLPDLNQLQDLIQAARSLKYFGTPQNYITAFNTALENATKAYESSAAPDEVNNVYWSLYDAICDLNLSSVYNLAVGKSITAHNDPSGNSSNAIDGSSETSWNCGRLSVTGKPYEETITEGWGLIDLGAVYDISKIYVNFGSTSVWHYYEVYVGITSDSLQKVGEKTTNSLPNINEDTYMLNDINARFIKVQLKNVQVVDGKRAAVSIREIEVYGKHISANEDALKKLVNDALNCDEADYQSVEYAQMQTVLSQAQELLKADSKTQAQVDDMKDSLQLAINNLVLLNKDNLSNLIQTCELINKNQLVESSLNTLNTKLEEAKQVLDNSRLQSEIDTAYNELLNVKNELVYQPANYDAVNTAIVEANKIKELVKDFTAVQNAIDAVDQTKDIREQDVVDGYAETINDAMSKITYKDADYAKVHQAIETAKALDPKDYVDYSAVDNAIKTVVEGLDIRKQSEVDVMAKTIEDAIASLVKKPVKVQGVIVKPNTYSSVKLSWNKVEGATGYTIARSTSEDGEFVTKIVVGDVDTVIVNKLKTGKTYFFKVCAIRKDETQDVYGEYSDIVSETPIMDKAPVISSVTQKTYGTLQVTWKGVAGAQNYYLERRKVGTKEWKHLKTFGSKVRSGESRSLETNTKYEYRVRASRNKDDEIAYSPYSNIKGNTPVMKTTTAKAERRSSTSARISWKTVSGANGYEVYRATSSSGKYSRIKTLEADQKSVVSKSLVKGKTYYYKVRAYRMIGNKKVYNKFSKVVSYKVQ